MRAVAALRSEGGLGRIFDVPRVAGPTEDGGLGNQQTSVKFGCAQRTQCEVNVKDVNDVAALKLVPADRVSEAQLLAHVVLLPEGVGTEWNVALYEKRMYVAIGDGALPEGAQSGFVGLLEYAEQLGCTQMVVGVKKSRADLRLLLKTFMFFGFTPLAPARQRAIASCDPDYMVLACAIDAPAEP